MWYILFAMIHQQDYTAYQTYALLDFNISFEKDIPADDILRAVIEVTEKYSLQGTTQGNGLTGGAPPVRFSM